MKTLANIDARVISKAIEKARPLTVSGRVAMENYRRFLATNTMTAAGLEASINSLNQINDAGLQSFVSTLRGLMPTSKRKIAVAYELLQLEDKHAIFAAGVEAENALAELYQHNAATLVSEIADGALDQYKTNPTIAELIGYAKSAKVDAANNGVQVNFSSGAVKQSLVPVINIASLGDSGMLVRVDSMTMILGARGGLTNVASLSDFDNLPSEVNSIITVLSTLHLSEKQANVVELDGDYQEAAAKYLGVNSLKIDLIGSISEMVEINGIKMSVDKALAILNASKDSIIANIVTSEGAKEILQLVTSILNVMENYRGILISGLYARKFTIDNEALYVLKTRDGYSVIVNVGGSVVSATKYDTVYALLADDSIIVSTELHNAISESFSSEMKAEVNTATVKQDILNKLISERQEYEQLLSKIRANRDELDQMSDPNPDKVKELDSIEKRVVDSLKTVNEEIDKIAKK